MSDKTNELIAEIASIDKRLKATEENIEEHTEVVDRHKREIARNLDNRIGLSNRRRQLFADLRSELGIGPERKPLPVETYEDPGEDPIAGKPAIETYTDPTVFDPERVMQAEYERRAKALSPTYKVEEFNIDNPMTESVDKTTDSADPYMRKSPRHQHIDPI